jgi:hypothetical protein
MKEKLSVTVDQPLARFLDSLPGRSRSEKVEAVLRRYREVYEDQALRRALGGAHEADAERNEREAWERTMETGQWSESAEETSEPSNSWPTPNPGRPSSSASMP